VIRKASTPGRLARSLGLAYANGMDAAGLASALDRAERAIERIERGLGDRRSGSGREEQLRARVAEAIGELDQLIREAQAPAHG
jgi:hypothetical protein